MEGGKWERKGRGRKEEGVGVDERKGKGKGMKKGGAGKVASWLF